ncbi:hypothetical protein, partial [Thermobifida halotolerans]
HASEIELRQSLTDQLRFWTERLFELYSAPSQDSLHTWDVNLAQANLQFLEGRLNLSGNIT